MKRMKSGFTLAEVLITLGIIGVIAAIVMPTVMTNHTFKTVGVKLQKFQSQLEGSSRPYVVSNENFIEDGKGNVAEYLLNSFLVTNSDKLTSEKVNCSDNEKDSEGKWSKADKCGTSTAEDHVYYSFVADARPETFPGSKELPNNITPLRLKDGTELVAYMLDNISEYTAEETGIEGLNTSQVGEPVFGVSFAPNVNGMTKSAQKSYDYVVTELGYVYPNTTDDKCMETLAEADYAVKGTHYKEGASCYWDDNGGHGTSES